MNCGRMAYFQRKAGSGHMQAFAVFASTHLSGTTGERSLTFGLW
jgi:hypothetical protein